MKKLLLIGFLLASMTAHADELAGLRGILNDGQTEVYLPLYTYHAPYAYSSERRAELNAYPLGVGIGKGITKESGEWEGVYALVFSDSHREAEPVVGYGRTWPLVGDKSRNISIGFEAFMTSRADTLNNLPFPGILPIITATPIESLKFTAVVIPGLQHGTGNVVFISTTYAFGHVN